LKVKIPEGKTRNRQEKSCMVWNFLAQTRPTRKLVALTELSKEQFELLLVKLSLDDNSAQ